GVHGGHDDDRCGDLGVLGAQVPGGHGDPARVHVLPEHARRALPAAGPRGVPAQAARRARSPALKMFRDRTAAGERLAAMLEQYRGSDVLVLAIPAGGVPVAAAIARSLGLALEVAPVSKVLFPWTTESGYDAVAFDGSV